MVIEVLVLQSERLMYIPIDALILFQTTPAGVVTKPNCRPYRSSLSGYRGRSGRSGSSGFIVGFLRLRWSSYVPASRSRSCRIVCIGNGFGQPLGVVAVACGVTGGVGDTDGDLTEVV